jgi:23S rRNA pseudouridine1911/1915/1917 synthase
LIVRYTLSANLPPPARTVVNVVQAALKIKRPAAEQLIHDGAVQCRGRALTQTHLMLAVGDEVEIDYAPQPVVATKKKNSTRGRGERFEVVRDDEYLIVVNKPAGLLTVPTPKREPTTLQSQVRKWLSQHTSSDQAICVHRLDRGVSGLLVFAKSHEVADQLRGQFAARKPQRRYTAIVQGEMHNRSGTIRNYLATDASLNRYSTDDPDGGELAITHYEVREVWRGVSLLEIRLETGRRNQIRIHLAEAGHPVLGDPRYRPQSAEHPLWPYKRLALHAETLGFEHPANGEALLFQAPWPQAFRDLRRQLKGR